MTDDKNNKGPKSPQNDKGWAEDGSRQINEQKSFSTAHFRETLVAKPKPDKKPDES